MTTEIPTNGATGAWFVTLRRYFVCFAIGSLTWEIAQLPLYTLSRTGSLGDQLFAVVHCTGGDLLIGGSALLLSLLVVGDQSWPHNRYVRVAVVAGALGLSYTIFSEWLNVSVRQSWDYTDRMPRLPGVGTGLSPLLQWVAVPLLAFWWGQRRRFDRPAFVETSK